MKRAAVVLLALLAVGAVSTLASQKHAAAPAASTPTITAPPAPRTARKPARQLPGDPYRPGSRFDLAFRASYAECSYLRYGSRWPVEHAVRVIRGESQPDFRDVRTLGCYSAFGQR